MHNPRYSSTTPANDHCSIIALNKHPKTTFASISRRLLTNALFLSCAGATGIATAGYSQLDITPSGGFISAYAGLQTGGSPWAGSNYEANYIATDVVVNEQTFTNNTGTASASYSGPLGTNSSSGWANMGSLGFSATNSASNAGFSGGAVNGGWVDTVLFSDPNLNGQAGLWMFDINVSGSMSATGFAGATGFGVTGYKDNIQLMKNTSFDAGNSDPISTDRQAAQWGVATYFSGDSASRVVADSMTFAVPFVWGDSFELGIYALARAGKRSSSGVAGISTSDLDFSSTLTWGGTVSVLTGGNTIVNYSLTSGSGINWDQPISPVPVPAAVWLFMSGLMTIAAVTRRSRRKL